MSELLFLIWEPFGSVAEMSLQLWLQGKPIFGCRFPPYGHHFFEFQSIGESTDLQVVMLPRPQQLMFQLIKRINKAMKAFKPKTPHKYKIKELLPWTKPDPHAISHHDTLPLCADYRPLHQVTSAGEKEGHPRQESQHYRNHEEPSLSMTCEILHTSHLTKEQSHSLLDSIYKKTVALTNSEVACDIDRSHHGLKKDSNIELLLVVEPKTSWKRRRAAFELKQRLSKSHSTHEHELKIKGDTIIFRTPSDFAEKQLCDGADDVRPSPWTSMQS